MTYQMTFKRCELKYLLNRTEKEQILLTMEPHMKRDHYCLLYTSDAADEL